MTRSFRALEEHDVIHTSILAYAKALVLFYDCEAAAYEIFQLG